MRLPFIFITLLLLTACKKESPDTLSNKPTESPRPTYTDYVIRSGQQYCDLSIYKALTVTNMAFAVKFDSTAIYQNIDPVNQYDINKLYGFSDGNNHQYNSARIGWSYNDLALRLYAYTYFNGVRQSAEITTVSIGSEINCSIRAAADQYIFRVNGIEISMPRAPTVLPVVGYQLYPYFGGDETAPHDIHIFLRDL